jgi:hypothetical protein
MSTDYTNTAASDDFAPTEPARPFNMFDQIDRLVAARVNTSTGVVENLNTVKTERGGTDGNVTAPPSLDALTNQMRAHQSAIDKAQAELDAVTFNRLTGRPEGPRLTGAARERAQAEIAQRTNELHYTIQLMQQTSEARIAWNQARAAEAAQAPDGTGRSDADAAVRREQGIQQLADTRIGGKPLGRQAATEMFDRAAAEEMARRLARGER